MHTFMHACACVYMCVDRASAPSVTSSRRNPFLPFPSPFLMAVPFPSVPPIAVLSVSRPSPVLSTAACATTTPSPITTGRIAPTPPDGPRCVHTDFRPFLLRRGCIHPAPYRLETGLRKFVACPVPAFPIGIAPSRYIHCFTSSGNARSATPSSFSSRAGC